MNDDLFVQIAVSNNNNKDVLEMVKSKISELQHQDNTQSATQKINNLQDFLNFLSKDYHEPIVLEKEYDPIDTDNGIGQIILWLQSSGDPMVKIDNTVKDRIAQILYKTVDNNNPNFYLEKTIIDGLYLWYEAGDTKEEFFGTVLSDKFKGFVRLDSNIFQ